MDWALHKVAHGPVPYLLAAPNGLFSPHVFFVPVSLAVGYGWANGWTESLGLAKNFPFT